MDNGKSNVLKEKSYAFALRIVKLYKYLLAEHREYVLSKQVLRSGTSIGANISEANQGQSRLDFVSKLSIALKEAVETEYWLSLLRDSDYVTKSQAGSLIEDCKELQRILTAAIKTTKKTNEDRRGLGKVNES
jgi:four helix bundle protein